jgi:hypothetical protein
LPVWGTLQFTIGALCGLISVSSDLEYSLGVALWILFAVGWTWLGICLLVNGIITRFANEEVSLVTEEGRRT